MQLLSQMLTSWFSTKMKKRLFVGVSLLIVGVLYLKIIAPKFNIHIPCIFNKITGFECPGCGLTRASLALLDGNIYQAFRYNMLVFILAPLYLTYSVLEKKRFNKQSNVIMISMLILTALFFILRNTQTFRWLAPTLVG